MKFTNQDIFHTPDVPGPWAVASPIGSKFWYIVDTRTLRGTKVGPAGNRRINYFDRAVNLASQRNQEIQMQAKSQEPAPYNVPPLEKAPAPLTDDAAIITKALEICERAFQVHPEQFTSPDAAKNYARLRLHSANVEGHEAFGVMFLDPQYGLITAEEMFRGTLTQTSVYPREVVKRALQLNAGAVILYHNHPSGSPEPSRADQLLTENLKKALALVDVRVLDHLVVGSSVTSMAERGMV